MTEVMRPERQHNYSQSPLRRSAASSTSLYLGNASGYQSRRQSYPPRRKEETEEPPSPSSSTSSSSSSSASSSREDLTAPPSDTSVYDTSSSNSDTSIKPSSTSSEIITNRFSSPPPSSPQQDSDELETTDDDDDDDDDDQEELEEDEEDEDSHTPKSSPTGGSTPTTTPDTALLLKDDTAVQHQPSRHVDYLSHTWKEEEIWSSWRHIVSKRWYYGERSRLENASWRTWAKQKNHLKTVSPETLNWLKDCDVTWLYGPLQTPSKYSVSEPASEPQSHLSKSNSFVQKKPILKKRSASEVMLQKSISASSLVKQAAAAVQAQQTMNTRAGKRRPTMGRAISDFVTAPRHSTPNSRGTWGSLTSSHDTSGLHTPEHSEKRHIRFSNEVTQCVAVESDGGEGEERSWNAIRDDSDESDDGLTMKSSGKSRKPLSRTSSRSSFNSDCTTIQKLPSTTLKDRETLPDIPENPTHSLTAGGFWRPRLVSPSPSQETLRPSNPSRNFLLAENDEDEEEDLTWTPGPSRTKSADNLSSKPSFRSRSSSDSLSDRGRVSTANLRRTASGMFMPYEEEEDSVLAGGILGKMVDTVNTAKDIAHVIWNVGWRK